MTRPTTSTSELVAADSIEAAPHPSGSPLRRTLTSLTPVGLAVLLFVGGWQLIVATGWRPDYLLPGPLTVLNALGGILADPAFWSALSRTLSRAALGFGLALVIGTGIGLATARFRLLRSALGSFITGLQTMPSVVWFPLAILLFGLGEQAITFVVILGAAPSIANGVLTGVDHVPPAIFRLGDVLGARGVRLYRFFVIPAALPSYVGGLNQGWAFAWRSLMAGELLVVIPGASALGNRLAFAQEFGDATGLIAYMIVILLIGITINALFATVSRTLRARRGLNVR